MQVYFPKDFPKNPDLNHTALRVKRVNEILAGIISGEMNEENIYSIEKELLQTNKPNNWNVHVEGNMERMLEVDFKKYGLQVSKHTGMTLEAMSTFTFYASVEQIKEIKPKK